jgi:hypothetical protein
MSRQQYKASKDAESVTAGILECYNRLSPEGRADVDAVAAKIIEATRARRDGLQGLGPQGAVELIGKVMMWLDHNPGVRR